MFAGKDEIEATAILCKRDDGWRIRFRFDNGIETEQTNPPFSTQEEAQAALDAYMAQTGIRKAASPQ